MIRQRCPSFKYSDYLLNYRQCQCSHVMGRAKKVVPNPVLAPPHQFTLQHVMQTHVVTVLVPVYRTLIVTPAPYNPLTTPAAHGCPMIPGFSPREAQVSPEHPPRGHPSIMAQSPPSETLPQLIKSHQYTIPCAETLCLTTTPLRSSKLPAGFRVRNTVYAYYYSVYATY